MAMSVADFPREIFKTNQGRKASNAAGGNGQTSGSNTPADGAQESSSPQAHGTLSPEGQPESSYFPATATEDKGKGRSVPSPFHSRQSSFKESSNQRSASGGQRPTTPGGTANIFGTASPQLNLEALNYETVLDASRNVGRFVDTGMKMPMNVCLGLARGFRNAPRLYNDDTVRPQEKVTDFASGLRVATKEFGFGLFDGISGLVTQPMRGAEKEGAMGLLKGFAKGIGGVALKPAAGFWSIPAYAMQGLNAEVRNLMRGGGWVNHIIAARAQQGRDEIEYATKEEVKDVVARWQEKRWEDPAKGGLRDWVKADVLGKGKGAASPSTASGGNASSSGQGQARSGVAAAVGASTDAELEKAIQASIQQTSKGNPEEDAEIEAAIRLSLAQMEQQTASQAQQPPQYDGSVPARYEELKSPPGAWPQTVSAPPPPASEVLSPGAPPPAYSAEYQQQPPPEKPSLAQAMIDEYFTGITDEEHQALIEEAVQRSIRAQMYQQSTMSAKEEKELQKAIEASKSSYTFGVPPPLPARQFSGFTPIATPSTPNNGETGEDPEEEEEMRNALEESERMDRERREQEEREKNEEAIVLEWVKKQSLAEEQFRGKSQRGLGGGEGSGSAEAQVQRQPQGQIQPQTQPQTQQQSQVQPQIHQAPPQVPVKVPQQPQEQIPNEGHRAPGGGDADTHHGPIQMEDRDWDEDEEFRKALEESMRMSGQGDAKGQ